MRLEDFPGGPNGGKTDREKSSASIGFRHCSIIRGGSGIASDLSPSGAGMRPDDVRGGTFQGIHQAPLHLLSRSGTLYAYIIFVKIIDVVVVNCNKAPVPRSVARKNKTKTLR
jgi:hypothetical protein